MLRTTRCAVQAALACGWIAVAGCGGDDEAAQRASGPPMAPSGARAPAARAAGENAAPHISSARFDPAEPGAGESVRAIVEASDSDGDGVRLGYVWSVGGENVAAHGAKLEVPALAKRGDTLDLRVTASDGRAESEPYLLSTVIGNRAPRLSGLVIQPAGHLTASGPITAMASGSDPDGDPVSYVYTWSVNGESIDESGPVFPGERLKRGDVLQVSVVASDEQSESEPLASPAMEVANAAPVIRSQPDTTGAEGAFTYHVVADDADGDRLRYGLGSAPEGMTVLAMSGDVDWKPRADQTGAHAVEIWVEDAQGARVTQRFELTIGATPAADPKASVPAAPAPAPASESEPESDDLE